VEEVVGEVFSGVNSCKQKTRKLGAKEMFYSN